MISQQTIDQVKEKLVKEFNPVEIYLYGPRVWGRSEDAEEDLEIYVVVDKADDDRHKMLMRGQYVLVDLDVPKALHIYTRDEFDSSASDVARFCYRVKHKGKLVYAKA